MNKGKSRVEVVAIVPARGGSKSIPRKNIKLLKGIPLIAYSIAAGLQARQVSRVIVSTDDREIAEIARTFGAEVPFMRPAEYARDDSLDILLFQHALSWLAKHGNYTPELIVQLRPTSPLRPPGLVDRAIEILQTHPDADSVRGVVPAGQNPHKMWRIKDMESPMENLLDAPGIAEPYNAPRQKLPAVYWQTGHIDVFRPQVILKGSMSGKNIYPLLVDPRYTIDIDTEFNWRYAEWLMDRLELAFVRP